MKRKSLSLFLCIAMIVSIVAEFFPLVHAEEKNIAILHNEQDISQLFIEQDQKELLYVQNTELNVLAYQWQILLNPEHNIWVDIYDKTQNSCEVSYALINNVMDESGSAYIRCAIQIENETVYSNEVCITVSFRVEEPTQEAVSFEITDYQLISEGTESVEIVSDTTMSTEVNTDISTFSLKKSVPGENEQVPALVAEVEEYVTITIKYLDLSSITGEEAAIYSPYIAKIEKGSEFKQDILSPTFLGFSPYYDNDNSGNIDDDATIISLDIPSVSEDMVINVYYKPIKVDFAIRYFFQNINDDLYTERLNLYHQSKAETGTIISDDYISSYAGDTTGFEKMYHIPENVAADGSTVFESYYDRNYYLIQFDLDGGYGIDPIYARYETPFIVNEPIKQGYVFQGWDLNNDGQKDTLPSTIPSSNQKYKALWRKTYTTYTMVFWKEKADSEGFEYWDQMEVDAESASIVGGADRIDEVPGVTEVEYFTYNDMISDHNIVVEGNGSTIVNVYYNRNYSTLYFYAYGKCGLLEKHTHSDDCYNLICNNDEHTHTTACRRLICPHPEKHTHSNTCKSNNVNNVVYALRAKYNQTVAYDWPTYNKMLTMDNVYKNSSNTIVNASGTKFYGWRKNGTGTNYISKRATLNSFFFTINGITTIKANYQKASTLNVSYWFESFDQVSGEKEGRRLYKGLYYEEDPLYTEKLSSSSLDHKEMYGMAANGTESETKGGEKYQYLYYTRLAAGDFSFYNVNQIVKTVTGLKYGQDISSYQFVKNEKGELVEFEPPYPEKMEENAYEFRGWYTRPECYEGSRVTWEDLTMTLENLTLYAKWVPKVHTVNFFTTYEDLLLYEDQKLKEETITVTPHYSRSDITHGTVVGSVENPENYSQGNMDLVFSGWFYIENGQKKAFSPLDMPINQDMNIFADWSSNQPQPYRIRYLLQNDPSIKVAEDTYGFAYGGSTRTFVAKAGNPYNQLYQQYNSGYFPTVGSHSITMRYEEDKENPKTNVYDFYYVETRNIEYTIRYVNKETNTLIEAETIKITSDSVVTERFKAFENMVPDAFYKRLVISVEWDEESQEYVGTDDNVITFYYTPNKTSSYYAVHFMLEKEHDPSLTEAQINKLRGQYYIDGTGGYEESDTHLEGVGDIGKTISINPQTFSGYEVIDNKYVAISVVNGVQSVVNLKDNHYNITVTKQGTELYIFYKRLEYNYSVHYYHYNTSTPVSATEFPSITKKDIYGATVTETAVSIPGYTCVSATTQSITVRDKEAQNVIIFYYAPVQFVVEYMAVPPEAGWLSNTIEVITGNKEFSGSLPSCNALYEFGGWFLDEECTMSAAGYGIIDEITGEFIPDKESLSANNRNVFYAKFILKASDLTIQRSNAGDNNQVFVYEVKNNTTGEVLTVTVMGNDSVTISDLPFGEYTITQQNNWSWRYTDQIKTVTHEGATGTTVLFDDPVANDQWLTGLSNLIRNQRG